MEVLSNSHTNYFCKTNSYKYYVIDCTAVKFAEFVKVLLP